LPAFEALLADFRARFPIGEFTHRGTAWHYRRGGDGRRALLWLTGALGVGDMAFTHAPRFAPEFRLLIPDYPPLRDLDECVDGLAALLDHEHVEAAHVVGGSFGGMLAQQLVRRHPSRVRSLVLSHTSAPQPSSARALFVHLVSAVVPERPYRALFRHRLRVAFVNADPFWLRYFDSTVDCLSKRDMVSRVLLVSEFLQRRYSPADLEHWRGRMLILNSEDDSMMPAQARASLGALYPRAESVSFSGTGHSTAILQPEEYANAIARFLASTDVGESQQEATVSSALGTDSSR
jgi:pimeloyl-ACP methyl ester carboxylesterase